MERDDRIRARKFFEGLSDERLIYEAVYNVESYQEGAYKMLIQEVSMRDLTGKVEEKKIEKWAKEDRRRERKRWLKGFLKSILMFVFIFFIFPSLCLLVAYGVRLSLSGEWDKEKFLNAVAQNSYEPVVGFYTGLKDRILELMKK